MTDHNENEITTEEKTEMTSVEYLRYCKSKLSEYYE